MVNCSTGTSADSSRLRYRQLYCKYMSFNTGFIRGEQFCCALGMLEGGNAVVGVLGCPMLLSDLDGPANSQRGQVSRSNYCYYYC
jgi:Inositol monophosphatase family